MHQLMLQHMADLGTDFVQAMGLPLSSLPLSSLLHSEDLQRYPEMSSSEPHLKRQNGSSRRSDLCGGAAAG